MDDPDGFFAMIDAALATIPSPFAEQLASVAIVVEDEASPEQLASVGAPGLYGLYQGVPRTRYRAEDAPVASRITLFRGPLERRYRTRDALAAGVAETLLHEVAHHLASATNGSTSCGARRGGRRRPAASPSGESRRSGRRRGHPARAAR